MTKQMIVKKVKIEQKLKLSEFKMSSDKIMDNDNVNMAQRRIVDTLSQFNDQLVDFMGELLQDEYLAQRSAYLGR